MSNKLNFYRNENVLYLLSRRIHLKEKNTFMLQFKYFFLPRNSHLISTRILGPCIRLYEIQ